MTPDEYSRYDALGLAELIRIGEVSTEEVFEAFMERVAAINPLLNAVVLPDFEAARSAIAAGLPDGPFRGVPYLIKDLHAPVASLPLSHGSRLFTGNVSAFDSTTVGRLRAAGFVIAGRTNAPEFGMSATTEPNLHGPVVSTGSPDEPGLAVTRPAPGGVGRMPERAQLVAEGGYKVNCGHGRWAVRRSRAMATRAARSNATAEAASANRIFSHGRNSAR
jgi:amidase